MGKSTSKSKKASQRENKAANKSMKKPTLFDCLLCPEYAFCAYDEGGTANCSRPTDDNERATKRANDKR